VRTIIKLTIQFTKNCYFNFNRFVTLIIFMNFTEITKTSQLNLFVWISKYIVLTVYSVIWFTYKALKNYNTTIYCIVFIIYLIRASNKRSSNMEYATWKFVLQYIAIVNKDNKNTKISMSLTRKKLFWFKLCKLM